MVDAVNHVPNTAIRGTPLELPRHPDTCDSVAQLVTLADDLHRRGVPLAADLFCGAGGLSLGLSDAGFEVIVGVDNDRDALATHASVTPGLHLNWDLGAEDHVEELADILLRTGVTLVAGGPPCQPFSKAGRSMIRDLVRKGRRPRNDQRRDLWQAFLAVVERVRPPAVLMENVPGMALDRDMLIFRTLVDELERLGYGVEARVVDTSRYGVPQYRQRLILIALEGERRFQWPHEHWVDDAPIQTRLWDAIGDLPDVKPGWRTDRNSPTQYRGPRTWFQQRARKYLTGGDTEGVHDHVTRPVRQDDYEAFQILTTEMKYSELPAHLKRYRDDIFDDKYKRLGKYDLSRTITAHLEKDGYWYIHPEYHRTLTVREAARIQTFRDDVRFSGSPTSAFRQIGNAVPPLLAEYLGRGILEALNNQEGQTWSTREVSAALARWMISRHTPAVPWLSSQSRWVVIAAEILLHRARAEDITHVWPILSYHTDPAMTLEAASHIRRIGQLLERSDRAEQLLEIASALDSDTRLLRSRASLLQAGIPAAVADTAIRVVPTADDDPILASGPVLRVAARFHGNEADTRNKRSDGRMAAARLVGVDSEDIDVEPARTGHFAHLALMDIAAAWCRPEEPDCGSCPLQTWCITGRERLDNYPTLFSNAELDL